MILKNSEMTLPRITDIRHRIHTLGNVLLTTITIVD